MFKHYYLLCYFIIQLNIFTFAFTRTENDHPKPLEMKILKKSAIFFSFAFALTACDNGTQGTEAEVGEAQEVMEITEASSYSIDTTKSQVIWNGRKPTGEHHGTIDIQEGSIQLKENDVVGGLINIDLTSLEVQDLEGEDKQKLTGHLKSPDFFYVEQYPTAKFVITSVQPYETSQADTSALVTEQAEDTQNNEGYDDYVLENPTHRVTGNLTMRDTTLSITIPASIQLSDSQVKAKSRFMIDRSKWNVNFMDETDPVARAKDKFIYNDVNVGFDVVAERQ